MTRTPLLITLVAAAALAGCNSKDHTIVAGPDVGDNATNATAVLVESSTDNITFAQIASVASTATQTARIAAPAPGAVGAAAAGHGVRAVTRRRRTPPSP